MPRKRLRKPDPTDRYGKLEVHDSGFMAFTPRDGVPFRVRCLADAEGLFAKGVVSPEAIERARKVWKAIHGHRHVAGGDPTNCLN